MKKVLTYFFLCILLYGAVGYYAVFLARQWAVRKEIKTRIKNTVPQSELFVFSFSEQEYNGLSWKKKNKEFQLGGSLYDIVKKKTGSQGTIMVYCINDEQESQLFADLEKQVQKNSSQSKDIQNVIKLFFNSYFVERMELSFFAENASAASFEMNFSLYYFHGKILSPPPESV